MGQPETGFEINLFADGDIILEEKSQPTGFAGIGGLDNIESIFCQLDPVGPLDNSPFQDMGMMHRKTVIYL